MSSDEWKSMELQDFVTLQRGHDLTEKERKPGNIPVYGSFGMSGYHNVAKAKGPGVTVGRSGGSFGVVNYSLVDFWPHNTALYVIDFHGNDEKFAYYYLKNIDFTRFNSGSAQASLNRNFIHPMEVKIPTLPTQQTIAHILGSLDDKIELNRQMNETLETMARAIFKSWFVDFDPVRAKAEGRDTGLPADVAALFPDGFEKVDGREVPRGWGIKKIVDVSQKVGMGPFGSSIKVETFVPDGMPIISGQHLKKFMLDDSTFKFISNEHAEKLKNSIVSRGDIIFTHAGNIGQAVYIPENSQYEQYILSQRQFFLRPDLKQVSPSYLAYFFTSAEGQDLLLANRSSSGVPSIARPVTYLRSIPILVPPHCIIDVFEKIVGPINSKYRKCIDESRTLAQIRDALLPKLMSGEIITSGCDAISNGGL